MKLISRSERCDNGNRFKNTAAIMAALGIISLNACSALYGERADDRVNHLIIKALEGDEPALDEVLALGAREYNGTLAIVDGANLRTTPAVIEDSANGETNKSGTSDNLMMINPMVMPDLTNPANKDFFGAFDEDGNLVWANANVFSSKIDPSKIGAFDGQSDARITIANGE